MGVKCLAREQNAVTLEPRSLKPRPLEAMPPRFPNHHVSLRSTFHFLVGNIFHSCLKADERNRWSASQLLEHSFITPVISNGLPNGPQDALRNNGVAGNDGPSFLVDQPEHEEPVPDFSFFSGVPGKSRVKCEFEELQFLGKGGFGNVIKVGAFSAVMKRTITDSNKENI